MPEIVPTEKTELRTTNPIWDTLVILFGEPAPNRRALYGRVTQYLTEQEATPALIRERASRIAMDWGPHTLTLTSLEKHWSRFDGLAGQLTRGDTDRALRQSVRDDQQSWVHEQLKAIDNEQL